MKIAAIIGCHPLQAADGDGLAIQASSAAGRLAGPVASAAEYAGKDIRLPVQHIRVRVAALRDQPNIFRNVRMGRASPLAVHNLVEVVRILYVSGNHATYPSGSEQTLFDPLRPSFYTHFESN
jgi:hypothetical protein